MDDKVRPPEKLGLQGCSGSLREKGLGFRRLGFRAEWCSASPETYYWSGLENTDWFRLPRFTVHDVPSVTRVPGSYPAI